MRTNTPPNEAIDWQIADLDEMLPGDQIGSFESPADWDTFGRLISLQKLAIYYAGSSRAIDRVPEDGRAIRGYGTEEAATRIARLMTGLVVDHAWSP